MSTEPKIPEKEDPREPRTESILGSIPGASRPEEDSFKKFKEIYSLQHDLKGAKLDLKGANDEDWEFD